ncbi:hypothetical protein GCM10019059_36750 [Camelimonas fluminis]|uniref:Uncharacterized protein n=1 Tax=Camelimonas fluminis TaxID=1576911 RepID=A0ABV7UJT4_9HYPH|nr:hypothetical protein [Camelimonas fluminis]GHE73862.1 hypothetical protein GCM10019059_36750 [Camelimonas fluminis]
MAVKIKNRVYLAAAAEGLALYNLPSLGLPTFTTSIMAATGITGAAGVALGFAGAVVLWHVAMKATSRQAPRLLTALGHAPIKLARRAGQMAPLTKDSFHRVSAAIFPDRLTFPGSDVQRHNPSPFDGDPLKNAMADLAQSKASITNLIVNEADYRRFMDTLTERGIKVIDLDGAEERAKREARLPFESPALAFSEIARTEDQDGGMTPEAAEELIDRLSKTQGVDPETKKALLAYIEASLEPFTRETETEIARLDNRRLNAEPALLELDNKILQRLRLNEDIAAALEKAGVLQDPAETLRNISHSVERHGLDKTLATLKESPESLLNPIRETRRHETPERSRELNARLLTKHPEIAEAVTIYVQNIGANSADAQQARQVKELRDRQSQADMRIEERERSIDRIKRRIERECAWIEPDIKRKIMRESIAKLVEADPIPVRKKESAVIGEASREITEAKRSTKTDIADISRIMKNADEIKSSSTKFAKITEAAHANLAASAYIAQTTRGTRLPLYAAEFDAKILPKLEKEIQFQARQASLERAEKQRNKSRTAGIDR